MTVYMRNKQVLKKKKESCYTLHVRAFKIITAALLEANYFCHFLVS